MWSHKIDEKYPNVPKLCMSFLFGLSREFHYFCNLFLLGPLPGSTAWQWEAHRETIKSDAVVSSSGCCKRNRKRCYKRFVSICWTCTFPIRCLCHHRKKLRLYTIQTSFEYEPLFVWLKFITLWFVLFNYCVPLTQQLLSPFRFQCSWMIWGILS